MHLSTLQCSAVQCIAVQISAVQCSAVRCNLILYCFDLLIRQLELGRDRGRANTDGFTHTAIFHYSTLHYMVQCSAVQYSVVLCSTLQCSSVQCSSVQCSPVCSLQVRTLGVVHYSSLWLLTLGGLMRGRIRSILGWRQRAF